MIVFKFKLNEYIRNKVISEHINPLLRTKDIPVEMDLCLVYPKCRPIFIKSKLYDNMDDLLTFIAKNSSTLSIYKDSERINSSNFIREIWELTVDAIDLDDMKNKKHLNNIYQELSKDKMGTIWLNKK